MNLRGKPFYLSEDDVKWVENTLNHLSVREKAGQLFCLNIVEEDVGPMMDRLKDMDIKPGGFMTRSFKAKVVQDNFRILQEHSEIPLLLAANLERGADGVCEEGTLFGTQMQVAATDEERISYNFGYVCGKEGTAVGANWNFGPITDIDYNNHNPITNTRVFSSNPDKVLKMSKAFIKGMNESSMAVCLKHWPGDGMDERDQHMVTSINTMTPEEWDKTYGRIYEELIDDGAQTIMSAHIMLPHYQRKLVPGLRDEEIMPGSLSYELNHTLLREQLGFNGLIVTDATSMNGFMQAMSRREAVPSCIAAGCDMFLFTCDLEEDFEFMIQGIEQGILSEERLDEAVTRILALKACLNLPRLKLEGTLVPGEEALAVFDDVSHDEMAKECADKAITLVKDTQSLLPLTPQKHKRILFHILGDTGGYHDFTRDHGKVFISMLEQEGFEITLFDGSRKEMQYMNVKISEMKNTYDLIMYFANIKTSGSDTVARIKWQGPGALNATRYIHEIPTIFISVDNPYHLLDVPAVKTFINGYTASPYVLTEMIHKLMGRSEFIGKSPVDPFCGNFNAGL